VPITTLDPKAALVIIDLQKGILSFPTAHPTGPVIANAAELAKAFRARRLPVVLVNVAGVAAGRTDHGAMNFNPPPEFLELLPQLDHQPSDILITKLRWGAFSETTLDAKLRELGVTQIVLAGISTSFGVESTARYAYEHGYNVALATDAMTDSTVEAHENSLQRIFPRLGETGPTEAVLAALRAQG
jgi:nicotinamidase-related amidase